MTRLTSTAKAILVGLVPLALATACGEDPGASADARADADTAEVEGFPDFTVAIDAPRLSGNAPLTIAFEAAVTGTSPSSLTYAWIVDGSQLGTDRELTHTFFRAGSSTVVLRATYTRADGEVKVADTTAIVTVRACADLRFDRFSVDLPTELPPGGTLRVKVGKLMNDGDAIEDSFQVALGLSQDAHFDPAEDLLVLGPSYESMTSGLSSDSSIELAGLTFTLPTDIAVGSWFAFLVADPGQTVNECQEGNNVEPATNSIDIDPEAGRLPNLVMQSIDLPDGMVVAQGDILNYSFRIKNTGEADAKQFRHAFWLSRDAVLSDDDRPLERPDDEGARVQSMPAGQGLGFFKSYRVPDDLEDGDWWIVGEVDATGLVGETDETDNLAASAHPFTMKHVVPVCADLALQRLLVSPLSTYWGGSVRLEVTVQNPGSVDVPAGWLFRAYLSLSRALDLSTATVVGTYALDDVPAGQTRTFEILVPITDDLPVVPHYVAGLLDPTNALDECSEANNVAVFGEAVKIAAIATLDVGVEQFDFHPDVVQAGETIKVQYDLANHGTSAATTFQVGVLLSADGSFTRDGIAAGKVVVVDRLTVAGLQPDEVATKIRDVVVPTGLDHAVTTYSVAVLADLDGFLGADTDVSNNLRVSEKPLHVNGATGGCFEDAHEPDDARIDATEVGDGALTDLGSCGDADWFEAWVPAGSSLLVDVDARPITAFPPVSSSLAVTLFDPNGLAIQEATFGPHYEVRAFAVPAAGMYAVRVMGATAADRAAYDLTVHLQAPRTGVDVVAYDVRPAPATSYPGGRVAVAWREVNLGTELVPARTTRVWLSKDRALDGNDLALGELASTPLAPQATVAQALTVAVPSNVPGGSWFLLVQADADGDALEVDEGNDLAVGGPIALDPLKVCADDDLEPNDEIAIATPLASGQGPSDAVVCPGLDDWFAVDLAVGDALDASVAYAYDPSKGKLVLELWDPSGQAAVLTESRTSTLRVALPSAWEAGRWLLRVANEATALAAPYHYALTAEVAPGPIAARCEGDRYEPDNVATHAVGIGCGQIAATLCNYDADWYVLQGKGAQRVDVEVRNLRSELYGKLFLPGGTNPVASVYGSGTLSYTPSASGPLLLKVEPRSGPGSMTAFDYTVKVTGLDGADLALGDLESPFAAVDRGEDAGVSFSVTNQCAAAAPGFEVGAFLSLDDALDPDDVPLGEWPVAGLQPAATTALAPKVTVPLSTLPGLYWLVLQADSGLVVPEGNEVDNVLALPLEVREPCGPDALEPNDARGAAPILAAPVDEPDLAICPYDQDWFAVPVEAGDRVHVAILFAQSDGDLDLRVYDGLGAAPVAVSQSTDDDEDAVVDAPLATTLFVRVAGYGSASAPYELVIELE